MADISTELARILSAIYGEDVRGSIHDAIEKINDVAEVVLTTGTDVTSPSSSSTGFYEKSLYLNTDTFELWKCTGVNTWASQGTLKGEAGDDGNGIVSIAKTATSGLVDTYTITYTDGNTDTFIVTNGKDGANGNKWYRGTGISGKAALPTVYTGSGVADANSGDMFLNPSEGAVYSCVTGGVPSVATWQYEMTLSGGSGGTSDYTDLTNKPSINGHTLSGNQTGADLGLANSSDIPTVDQTYSATSSNAQSGKAVAEVVEQIYADNGVLGAKNLLPNGATSQTIHGITFTVNADGSVTANGTITEICYLTLTEHLDTSSLAGCLINGLPIENEPGIAYRIHSRSSYVSLKDFVKNNDILTDVGNDVCLSIRIATEQTINNLTFYPMLRLASDPDDTYVPYAMTNRELTEAIASIPTVNDGQLIIQQNGTNKATFTANQSGNATANIVTDEWTTTRQVQSDGTVTFTGLNDSYSYSRPYYELPSGDSAYTFSKVTKSGSGTSVTLTYTTDAPSATVCKLRILK